MTMFHDISDDDIKDCATSINLVKSSIETAEGRLK